MLGRALSLELGPLWTNPLVKLIWTNSMYLNRPAGLLSDGQKYSFHHIIRPITKVKT